MIGAIAGLVGITPAAGYVSVWIAVSFSNKTFENHTLTSTQALIGFLTGVICSLCQNVDKWIKIDEGMDVFKLHGIGGMTGSFLTGIFAQSWVYDLDGMGPYDGLGAMDGVGVQVGRQLAEIVSIASYSFVVSCILLYALKFIPGLHLRVSNEAEMMGLDMDQFNEEEIGKSKLLCEMSGLLILALGDWSMFHQNAYEANVSSASSHSAPAPAAPAAKEA